MKAANNNKTDIKKNHMDVLWHEYADRSDTTPISRASLSAKASVVGRVGIMMLSCGTGAWRVRSSMNTLSELMGMTCTVDIHTGGVITHKGVAVGKIEI